MKTHLMLFLIIISFFGCTKKNEYKKQGNNLHFKTFPEQEEITGNPIKINKELFVARKLWSYDSLLFIKDQKTNNKLIHVFNLKNYEYITSAISKGGGPGELTSISSAYIDERNLYVHDLQTQKILEVNIDSLLTNKYSYSSYSTITSQKSKVLKFTKLSDKIIGELMPAYNYRFQIFDEDLRELSSFGIFPPLEKFGNIDSLRFLVQVKGNLFQGDMITVSEKNLMIVSHPFIDLIEIFDLKSETKVVNIIGPEGNYPPKYQLLNDGYGIPCKECKFAYNSVRCLDNKIYALYSGIEYRSRSADASKTLFVFDINGKPLKKISLNISLTDFVLYEKENNLIMYGLSPDSEDILYEFILE